MFGPLQRALSCVAPSVLTGRRYYASPIPHVLFFGAPSGFSPLGRVPRFSLAMRHFYRLSDRRSEQTAARWRIATVGYIHEIADRHLERVVAYHWHPPGSGLVTPHLHVGRQFAHPSLPEDVRGYADRLVRSHLPTGPIVLPTVLRLVIAEFGVEPLRDDWQGVLDEAEREVRGTLPPG